MRFAGIIASTCVGEEYSVLRGVPFQVRTVAGV